MMNFRYLYSPILFDSQDLNHNLSSTRTSCPRPCFIMLLYLPYAGWPLAMEMENGDAVTPATPGTQRTRIPDAGKRAWFSVMEMNWHASRFRCGAAPNTMVNMLGFSPMHNGDGYHLSFLVPAACSRYIVMPLGLASAMENGECNPGSLPTQLGPGEGPMFYLRVGGTMHQWRRWRTKKIYTSSSLRGSDA